MFIKELGLVMLLMVVMTPQVMTAHEQEGCYTEPGEFFYPLEDDDGWCWDGIYYMQTLSDVYDNAVAVIPPISYPEKLGGYYIGELTIPSEMYGYGGHDCYFTVTGVYGMYKNGLTGLYLPETIEDIPTVYKCRFLERVILNNSLKKFQGISDCPVLVECPLPLSLEEIGDGSMSGIAISEALFPDFLTAIGRNVFCNDPNLEIVSLGNLEVMGDSCFCDLPALREIVLPNSLVSMGEGSFADCIGLEKVMLSENAVFSEGTFNGCPNIKEVSVFSEIPYTFPENCMTDVDKSQCVLYVPENCGDAYSAAPGWKDFGKIVPSLRTGIDAVMAAPEDWRAFSFAGKLIADIMDDISLSIHDLSGQTICVITGKGRKEVSLPKGIYVIASHNKRMKISI
jgi:hypothetical protein